jgi:hypothetical protein
VHVEVGDKLFLWEREMKTSLFVFLLIPFFIITSSNAQHGIGIIGGINFAEVNIDPLEDGEEVIPRNGFSLGTIININFSPIFGLQFEPSYMQKGSEFKAAFVLEGYNVKIEETIEAAYIDLPVLFRVTLQTSNVQPYLVAGVAPAFLVGDIKEVLNNITIDGIDITNQIPDNEKEIELKSNSFDIGMNFGGGLSIPLKSFTLFIEGQYSLGLLDVNNQEPEPGFEKTQIRNRGFQAKLGISFPLKTNQSEGGSSPSRAD